MNNATGATLVADTTVSGALNFNSGNITTGVFNLIDTANCATHTRTSGHVVGNIKMSIPAGASTCIFEVGTGANYTPVSMTFPAGTGAGNITAATTTPDHAQIATSGLDSTQDINRVWTLTNDTGGTPVALPAAGYTAQFTWVAGDQDVGVNTAVFEVARFSGGGWNASSVTANAALSVTIRSRKSLTRSSRRRCRHPM